MRLIVTALLVLAASANARRVRFQTRQEVVPGSTGVFLPPLTGFNPPPVNPPPVNPPPPPPPPTYQPVINNANSGYLMKIFNTVWADDFITPGSTSDGDIEQIRVTRNPDNYYSGTLAKCKWTFTILEQPGYNWSGVYSLYTEYQNSSGGWSGICTFMSTLSTSSSVTYNSRAVTTQTTISCAYGNYDQYTNRQTLTFSGTNTNIMGLAAGHLNSTGGSGYILPSKQEINANGVHGCTRDGEWEDEGEHEANWIELRNIPFSEEEINNLREMFDEHYEGEFDELHADLLSRGFTQANTDGGDPGWSGETSAR